MRSLAVTFLHLSSALSSARTWVVVPARVAEVATSLRKSRREGESVTSSSVEPAIGVGEDGEKRRS